jgi:hypothetical protein
MTSFFLKGNPNYPSVEFWRPYSSLLVVLPRYTRPSYEPPDVFQPSSDSTKTSCSRIVFTNENCAADLNLLKRRKGKDLIIVHVCVTKHGTSTELRDRNPRSFSDVGKNFQFEYPPADA